MNDKKDLAQEETLQAIAGQLERIEIILTGLAETLYISSGGRGTFVQMLEESLADSDVELKWQADRLQTHSAGTEL